jgi:8-oxo-dGTP diphosphatase
MENRFNIRAYGILLNEGKILVNEELIRGKLYTKFPGGGLHFGEGLADCLKREWKEELELDINVVGHFYTTDFFQPSAYDDSQVISIYYWVSANEIPEVLTNHVANERTFWMEMKDISEHTFTLPIDKIVGGMLKQLSDRDSS